MARSTGAATSFSDLLDAISTAAVASGWTEEQRYTESDNSYDTLALSQGGSFAWYICQDGTDIIMTMSDSAHVTNAGFNTFNAPGKQADVSDLTFPVSNHYIYHSSTEVHVAIEFESGRYRHLSFGIIEKVDSSSWTGGEYVVGCDINNAQIYTFASTHSVLWDAKSAGNNRGLMRTGGLGSGGYTWSQFGTAESGLDLVRGSSRDDSIYDTLYDIQPNNYNQRSRYFPIFIYLTGAGSTLIPLGYVKNARRINMNLITPGAQDGDNLNWYIYPTLEKSATLNSSPTDSGDDGVAYQQ